MAHRNHSSLHSKASEGWLDNVSPFTRTSAKDKDSAKDNDSVLNEYKDGIDKVLRSGGFDHYADFFKGEFITESDEKKKLDQLTLLDKQTRPKILNFIQRRMQGNHQEISPVKMKQTFDAVVSDLISKLEKFHQQLDNESPSGEREGEISKKKEQGQHVSGGSCWAHVGPPVGMSGMETLPQQLVYSSAGLGANGRIYSMQPQNTCVCLLRV